MKPILLPVSPPFSQRLQCPNHDDVTITSLMQEMQSPSIIPVLDTTTMSGRKEIPLQLKNKLI